MRFSVRKFAPKVAVVAVIGIIGSLINPTIQAGAEVPAKISTANYPVGMDEDSSGNIYIASEVNSAGASHLGLIVVPKNTGTLFGVSVTAGQEARLYAPTGSEVVRGVAVDSLNDLIFSTSEGKLFALTSTTRTLFGVSVPANTPTQLFSGTYMNAALQFDSTGQLFGIDVSHNNLSVLTSTSGSVFGVSVTANTPTLILTLSGGWFWDLAIDTNDNVLINNGFAFGVWILPKVSGTFFGQSVTANTPAQLTAFDSVFASRPPSGIDLDASGNVFVSIWGDSVYVYAPTTFSRFGQTFNTGSLTQIIRTKYGRTNQGVAALADGSLVTGGGDGTYLIKDNSTEAPVQSLNLAATDTLYESGYLNDPNQSYATWGVVQSSDSTVTKFNQHVPIDTEGAGYDATTNKTWLMKNDCKVYSLDDTDTAAPTLAYTISNPYDSQCWGFATNNDGTALVTTGGTLNRSKLYVIDLATGAKVTSNSLNDLLLQDDCLAIAVKSNGDIWCSSNQSWNLHKVNPANGAFTDSVAFYDRTGGGITGMDFDSNGRLIGSFFGLSEGTTSIDMNAADPISTVVINETTDRYGWTSRAMWVRKNYRSGNNPSSGPTSGPTADPSSAPSAQAAVATVAAASAVQESTPKFRFSKGISKLSAANKAKLLAIKNKYFASGKIVIATSAGLLPGVPRNFVQRFATNRGNAIKAFLVANGIPASRIEIEVTLEKFGVIPKSNLRYSPN